MNAGGQRPRNWLAWTATTRTGAFVAVAALAAIWVVLGVWCVVGVSEAIHGGREIDSGVFLGLVAVVGLAIWLVTWVVLAYERWMLEMVDPAHAPAWTTRVGRADALLLRSAGEDSDEAWRGGLCVFTVTPSAIVFWTVRSNRGEPILRLPASKIESVWRRDLRPALTYVSLIGVDPTAFVGLSPGRGRLRSLIRDREEGFRAIGRLFGPSRVRTTEVRGD